jgi:uncharacterized membrane protein YfcA
MNTLVLLLFITGCFGGFLAGLLGVGGGLIFIPILTYIFSSLFSLNNEEIVRYTLANSISLVFISGVSGIYRQVRMNIYQPKNSLIIGVPGAISAFLMSYGIQHSNWYSHQRFQWVFLLFLVLSILNMILKNDSKNEEISPQKNPKNNTLPKIFVGILAGIVVSLSGLGGGIIMVPLFRMILKFNIRESTALSLSVVPILSILPLVSYLTNSSFTVLKINGQHIFQTGYIAWPYFLPMAFGVIIFSSLGQKIASKTPSIFIRVIFAMLSSVILIKSIYEIYSAK